MLANKSTIYNEGVNIDLYTFVKIGNNDNEVQFCERSKLIWQN